MPEKTEKPINHVENCACPECCETSGKFGRGFHFSKDRCRCFDKLLFAFLVLVCLGAWIYFKHFFPQKGYLTVIGTYTTSQGNDVASFYATVQGKDAEKDKAVSNAETRSNLLTDTLTDFGLPNEDVKTSSVNVYQETYFSSVTNRSEYGDWIASISIEVKVRDISRVDDLTKLLSAMEISNLSGPNYALDELKESNQDNTALLEKAIQNAHEKAKKTAEKSGRKLGAVISLSEGYNPNPIPSYGKYNMDAGMGGGGMAINTMPGSSSVSAFVTVTYELK